MGRLFIPLAVGLTAVALGVAADHSGPAKPKDPPGVRRAAVERDFDGLHFELQLAGRGDEIYATTYLRNDRRSPVTIERDRCRHFGAPTVVGTRRSEPGRVWPPPLQAVKARALGRPPEAQITPFLLWPVEQSGAEAVCAGPAAPFVLQPGRSVHLRWSMFSSSAIDHAGSARSTIRVGFREQGGGLHTVRIPAGEVTSRPERPDETGRLFDRFLAHDGLRRWLERESPHVRGAQLLPADRGGTLRVNSASYERAATASIDGDAVRVRLPRERTRRFPSRSATLPAGVRVVPEPEGFVATRDLMAGRLALPSGRLVIDPYFFPPVKGIAPRAAPGRHPVHVTLARSVRNPAGGERVALATMTVGTERTVRWRRIGRLGVDGGTAAFAALETARATARLADPERPRHDRRVIDSWIAHDYLMTRLTVAGAGDAVYFGTGHGDGGYAVYAGLDARGDVTRYVLDCGLLHLDWPTRRSLGSGRGRPPERRG